MAEKPTISRIEFHRGNTLLTAGIRTFVVDTLFHKFAKSPEDAAALWTTATSDDGPDGDHARQLIERTTGICITIKTNPPQ